MSANEIRLASHYQNKFVNHFKFWTMWNLSRFVTYFLHNFEQFQFFFNICFSSKLNKDIWEKIYMHLFLVLQHIFRCRLTFGLIGLSVGMSVPSALCLLESKTFLLLVTDFWQILTCFSYKDRKHDMTVHCKTSNKICFFMFILFTGYINIYTLLVLHKWLKAACNCSSLLNLLI